jgi:hypothetical protein
MASEKNASLPQRIKGTKIFATQTIKEIQHQQARRRTNNKCTR